MTHGDEGGKSEGEPDPPDGGWGWVVAFASFLVHIITDGVTYSFGVMYVVFLNYFNEGAAATSWIASILVGVTYCSGPISSILVNKYGCQKVTMAGAIIAAASLILSMFATNVLTLYFTIGVGTGFGFGLIYLPAIVSVTCWFKRKRSLATGIAVAGSGLGTFIFSPLTNWLLLEFGWRGTLLLIAAFVFQCTTFGALFRPVYYSTPKEDQSLNESVAIHIVAQENRRMPRTVSAGYMSPEHRMAQQVGSMSCLPKSPPPPKQQFQSQTLSIRSRRSSSGIGLMSRSDILYLGSIHDLPQNKSSRGNMQPLMGEEIAEQPESKPMFDFTLFKDPVFVTFAISNFCTQIGVNIPYVYIVAQAESKNVVSADLILSGIGIANTISRIILGYLCDKTSGKTKLLIYNGCLTGCGIATALSIFCDSFSSFVAYGTAFGFLIGAYVSLTSVILADLFGLEKMSNAFGIILLFSGVAALMGPPIAGRLYDATLSYDPGFVASGVMIAISGVTLFLIPVLQKKAKSRQLMQASKSLSGS